LLALALRTSVGMCALAAAHVMRIGAPAHVHGRSAVAIGSSSVLGIIMVLEASSLAHRFPLGAHAPLTRVAVALAGPSAGWALAQLAVAAALAALVIALIERRGFDRLDAAPPGTPSGSARDLSLSGVEGLLFRRERGVVRLVIVGVSFLAIASMSWSLLHTAQPHPDLVVRGAALVVLQMGWASGFAAASLSVNRDVLARPLLAPLPIAPRDTLAGKVALVRRLVLALVPALILMLPIVPAHFRWALAWRAAAAGVGLAVAADVMVSVAFLTGGIGASRPEPTAGRGNLASMLIFMPLASAVLAPGPLQAVLSLLLLSLLGLEARRAARRAVLWLDDSDDELERETPVWRALMTLAAFFAAQRLITQLVSFTAPAWTPAARFGAPAILLLLLTARGREHLPPLRLGLGRRIALPLGLLAGALTGASTVPWHHLIARVGLANPASPGGAAGPLAHTALLIALFVCAPIAEEVFFRGWLQDAFAVELPARWRRAAFALAALVFAAIHPLKGCGPTVLLGLVTGALYDWSGGLVAGMVAHAAHNAVALWLR
jgi:membrane protease YdiL (CAAX protease family)